MMKNGFGKNLRFVLFAVFAAGAGLLAGPRLHAAFSSEVYPPDTQLLVNRTFDPADFTVVSQGETITVTVEIANNEDVSARGFYYSDQVPNGWTVDTLQVLVNGLPIVDYAYGQGTSDEVYAGFTPHRWALEMPEGGGVFSPNHSIPASGATAQITYTMLVSGGVGSDYAADQEGWAAWLETSPVGTAVFGYQSTPSELKAEFTANPRSGEAPLIVQFTDVSTGDATAWEWDFGDGGPSDSRQHPLHTYALPGAFTVTLTITGNEPPQSDTIAKPAYVTVTRPLLEADFIAQPRFGLPPLTVQFTDLSVGDVLTRVWSFGDGGTAVLPSPVHTYSALGYYTVTLTVEDAYGSDTLVRQRYIQVTDTVFQVYLPLVMKEALP